MSFSYVLTTITAKNFPYICRICFSKEKLFPIGRTYISEDLKVSNLLEYSVMMDVKNKSFPRNICENCLGELYKVYEFKKKCENSEGLLKIILEAAEFVKNNVQVNVESSRRDDIAEEFNEDNIIVEELKFCIEDDITIDVDPVSVPSVEEDIVIDKCDDQDEGDSTTKSEIKCDDCDYIATTREEIKEHSKNTKHLNCLITKCEICDRIIFKNRLRAHVATHKNEKPYYECEICSRKFKVKQACRRHKMIHTGERPFMCTFCGRGFTRIETLRHHEKYHKELEISPHSHSFVRKTKFTCDYCGCGFKNQHYFSLHLRKHTSSAQSNPSDKPRDYVCEICGRGYTSAGTLTTHKLTHGEKKFSCDKCEKSFTRNAFLQEHSKIHTGAKPYTCHTCKKSFRQLNVLHTHELTHSDVKSFRCKICDRGFKHQQNLMRHVLTHAGEKPFRCQYCGKSFGYKQNMRVHERIHTGEKPYVCPVCGKGFYASNCMKKHRRTHREGLVPVRAESEEEQES